MPGQSNIPLPGMQGAHSQTQWVLATRHGDIDMNSRTAIMGVLNVTPDSFSDGGDYLDPARAVGRGIELAEEGADVIDIGGESTRPGSEPVSDEEELERVLPVIQGLRRVVHIPLSVDTTKALVAGRALDEGVDIINDISALRFDRAMASLVAREKVPVVLMHMQGMPRTMQSQPNYRNVVMEVVDFLRGQIDFAKSEGVDPVNIIIDPGIGFGKNLDHNLELLRSLTSLSSLRQPLLVGPSRKTFIGKVLQLGPEDRLEGSIAAAVAAAMGGANMVRVHDVKATFRALRVADKIRFGATS